MVSSPLAFRVRLMSGRVERLSVWRGSLVGFGRRLSRFRWQLRVTHVCRWIVRSSLRNVVTPSGYQLWSEVFSCPALSEKGRFSVR